MHLGSLSPFTTIHLWLLGWLAEERRLGTLLTFPTTPVNCRESLVIVPLRAEFRQYSLNHVHHYPYSFPFPGNFVSSCIFPVDAMFAAPFGRCSIARGD